jgi:serine/threonine-protein kinase HipA
MTKDALVSRFYILTRYLGDSKEIAVGTVAVKPMLGGRIAKIQFKYDEAYCARSDAFPIHPFDMPLSSNIYDFPCGGKDVPGFIDDLLPDDWGRKLIAMRLHKRFISVLDLFDNIYEGVTTGAYKLTPRDLYPSVNQDAWAIGVPLTDVALTAQIIAEGKIESIIHSSQKLSLMFAGGSKAGGACPKLLVHDLGIAYLLKMPRPSDTFDTISAEWAAMKILGRAGARVAECKIFNFSNGMKGLLVKRFDITTKGERYPLLTINGMLKDKHSQDDPLYGTYSDIADCIKKYSCDPYEDLKQLFIQLLVNQALSNTDDHLRNFSMIRMTDGWRLSPAYDVLPQHLYSGEHAIGLNITSGLYLPRLNEGVSTGRGLGVKLADCKKIISDVKTALIDFKVLLIEEGIDNNALLDIVAITQGE